MVLLIASLLVIDIIIIGSWVGLEQVKDRIVETTLAQESRDEFDIYSFRMWQDYPLFGAGAGSFYGVFPRYREREAERGFLEHAHNDYLEFLAEYGILGMRAPGRRSNPGTKKCNRRPAQAPQPTRKGHRVCCTDGDHRHADPRHRRIQSTDTSLRRNIHGNPGHSLARPLPGIRKWSTT